MLSDLLFSQSRLAAFLEENDTAFTHPLSEVLKKQGITVREYAEKLAKSGTIAYEEDKETGRIKGVVIGYTHNLPEDGGSYITQVVTALAFRKQGVFTRIMQEYIDYCKEQGISYIWLSTGVKNAAARAAYERIGFQLAPYESETLVKYVLRLT